MQRPGPTEKKEKEKAMSVLYVLAPGLSLCAYQKEDFA